MVEFAWSFDVFVSEDGSRMGGTSPGYGDRWIAWLRIDEDEDYLPANEDLELPNDTISFELSLDGAEGDGFIAGETYVAYASSDGTMGGDFGSFWSTEISIRPEDGAILLGPVPATHPGLPVSVLMQRDGTEVLDAVVTLPSGATYSFDAVATE